MEDLVRPDLSDSDSETVNSFYCNESDRHDICEYFKRYVFCLGYLLIGVCFCTITQTGKQPGRRCMPALHSTDTQERLPYLQKAQIPLNIFFHSLNKKKWFFCGCGSSYDSIC